MGRYGPLGGTIGERVGAFLMPKKLQGATGDYLSRAEAPVAPPVTPPAGPVPPVAKMGPEEVKKWSDLWNTFDMSTKRMAGNGSLQEFLSRLETDPSFRQMYEQEFQGGPGTPEGNVLD
jgi:hypothetical protein